jgi:3-oxoacyl-[acyl-carrier protein] reductase
VLKGKIALVTGSAKGIGRAIALELAQQGVHIAVNDLKLSEQAEQTAEMVREKGVRGGVYVADVADRRAAEAMISEIKSDFGSLDILINNAGISPKRLGLKQCVHEIDPDEWQRVVDVNLTGVFNCTRYAAPIMMANGWGRIVNLSSMAGRVYSPIPGIHYCATKAAVIGFTRVCAAELAPHNIIVNAVAPGRIDSDMTRDFGAERTKALMSTIPAGRYGTAEDVAKTVRFLVSEDNGYIVGATIDINGGRAML